MKNKAFKAIAVCFAAVIALVCFPAAGIRAKGAYSPEAVLNDIVSFKLSQTGAESVQGWLDGDLTKNAGASAEWYVIALRQAGCKCDFSLYADALESALSSSSSAAATRQRCALALIAAGRPESSFAVDDPTAQGLMNRVFSLHLFNNGCTEGSPGERELIGFLLSAQLADGGWALNSDTSDVDVTSMVLQSLAPYLETREDVKSAVDSALALLSGRQLASGGFSSYGRENPESAAQVIIALSALKIDCLSDGRFIKNGKTAFDAMLEYRLPDGSFSHASSGAYNHSATFQAMCACTALWRMNNGLGSLYIFGSAPDGMSAIAEVAARTEKSDTKETSGSGSTQTEPVTAPETSPAASSEQYTQDITSQQQSEKKSGEAGYKQWVYIAAVILAAAVCVVLAFRRKLNFKNFIFTVAVVLVVILATALTDIKSADSYYSGVTVPPEEVRGSVTLTIRCDTVAGKAEDGHISPDGVILPVTSFEITEGDTVYDVLMRAAREYKIHTQSGPQAAGSGGYISGINYIYELEFGDLSGWIYRVNGEQQSVGCAGCVLSDGDSVEWLYTCEMGNDIK
ncbi:MAG: DUF4430 domain-containing protein [Clostridiales bacterium]|nr:DUF4430 domain-containing protein [Clostridiales bacterium]